MATVGFLLPETRVASRAHEIAFGGVLLSVLASERSWEAVSLCNQYSPHPPCSRRACGPPPTTEGRPPAPPPRSTRSMNPFRDPSVQHFPQFERAFAASPSIDTLARTQPVEFSLGATGARSPILRGAMSGGSPAFQPLALPHNHHGPTRARSVAKQLDFSLSPNDVHVSRSDAAVAGWYAPTAHPKMSGSSVASDTRGLAAKAAAPAEYIAPLTPPSPDVQAMQCSGVARRHAAVQTDAANDLEADVEGRAVANIATAQLTELSREAPPGCEARAVCADSSGSKMPGEAAETAEARPEPARTQPTASQGLPPPQVGIAATRAAAWSSVDASGMSAAASAGFAGAARFSNYAEEERHALRRSLSQPPSYPFTEYLEGLRRRWSDPTPLPGAAPPQTHLPQQTHSWRAQSATSTVHHPPQATYGPSKTTFGGFGGSLPPAPTALPPPPLFPVPPAAAPGVYDQQWCASLHPYAPQPYMRVSPPGPWWPAVVCVPYMCTVPYVCTAH